MKNTKERATPSNDAARNFKPIGNHPATTTDRPRDIKAPVIFGRDMCNDAARTPWPRFGRVPYEDLLQTSAIDGFTSPSDKSGMDVLIYMAGCSGLQNKAHAYKLPLFKVGVTQIPDLQVRQRDLNSDAYGSASMQDGKPVFEETWTNWEMRQAELLSDCAPDSPVQLVARGLSVNLPGGMSPPYFEKEIHRRLYPCALHIFAKSKLGQKHFGLLDIDLASVPRFISYGFGQGTRLSLANEIYICRPREDWTRLRVIAEAITRDAAAQMAGRQA